MRVRQWVLTASVVAMCLLVGRVFTSAQTTTTEPAKAEQKADDSKAGQQGATEQAAGNRRGRGGGPPGMSGEERDAFVAVTTKNTYTPMDTKDANGNIVKHKPVGVSPITDEIYESYSLDRFYKKMLKIHGILLVGSQRVSDFAFLEGAYTMDHQFYNSPQWVRDMYEPLKIRLAILSVVEFTMDLPENNRGGRNSALGDALYQDGRSRGLGGMPWCSCAEENLLNLRGDRYGGRDGLQGQGENITIHEFSHTTASAIQRIQGRDGPFWTNLRAALAAARFEGNGEENKPPGRIFVWNRDHGRNGQPGNVYGGSNEQEYWAEGAQAWYNNANPNNSGGITTREEVKAKDPPLAALLTEIYGDAEWRYIKTTATNPDGSPMRPAAELAHLAGIDRTKIPVFNNNNSPRVQAAAANPELAVRSGGGGRGGRRGRGERGGAAGEGGARAGEGAAGGSNAGGTVPASTTTPAGGQTGDGK